MPFVAPGPAQHGEVGDRQLVSKKWVIRQSPVHHAIQPPRLGHEALKTVTALGFIFQCNEVMHLPRDRAEAAHLKHQPFEHRHARRQALRQKLARLLRQIKQDRAGLKHADGRTVRAVRIDDGRDLVVGADLEKRRSVLLALRDVNYLHVVGQAHFFERDTDLAAVGCVESVELDGHAFP